jgi:hypothetical protein
MSELNPLCEKQKHGRMRRVVMSHPFDGRDGHWETWECETCGYEEELFYPDIRPELARLLTRRPSGHKAAEAHAAGVPASPKATGEPTGDTRGTA